MITFNRVTSLLVVSEGSHLQTFAMLLILQSPFLHLVSFSYSFSLLVWHLKVTLQSEPPPSILSRLYEGVVEASHEYSVTH